MSPRPPLPPFTEETERRTFGSRAEAERGQSFPILQAAR
jgi:hypothetical protein